MGTIEKILTAADPLISDNLRQPVRYYAVSETMVIHTSSKPNGLGNIVVCFSEKEPIRFYYTFQSRILENTRPGLSKEFLEMLGDFRTKRKFFVFSGYNVFRYFQLGEPLEDNQIDQLSKLHALCLKIKDSNEKIAQKFFQSFERSFTDLSAMDGNDENVIGPLIEELLFGT
jgi:hypothetical protein